MEIMNKTMFIKKLASDADLSENDAIIVNSILEDNFFLSKSNKDKIVSSIENDIDVSNEKALEIYDICVSIAKEAVKNRLKHPFKNLNK